MKCSTCGEEVILVPSAAERARRHGETAAYYTSLFPKHTHCILKERAENVSRVMALHRNGVR